MDKQSWKWRSGILLALFCTAAMLLYKVETGSRRGPGDAYVIGAIFDLTGSLNYMGKSSLQGATLAVSDINARGGVLGKPMNLDVEDGRSNASATLGAFKQMIATSRPPVVIGFNSSSGALAVAPVAEREKVTIFSVGAASPAIRFAGDYIFRNRLSGDVEMVELARFAYQSQGLRRCFVLYIQNDYGKSYKDAFEAEFRRLGGGVIESISFQQDQVDFRSLLERISAERDDAFIFLASHATEAGAILSQASERGLKRRWFASNAIDGPNFFSLAGAASDGVMLSVSKYDPAAGSAIDFARRYERAFSEKPDMFSANSYDAVLLLSEILKAGSYDSDAIRLALLGTKDFPGVAGPTSFDENGDVLRDVTIQVGRSGRFVPIDKDTGATE